MPNWCSNYVSISGPKEKVALLWGAMNEKGGLLEAIKPIGEWNYYAAIEKWGTKWDIDTRDLQVNDIDNGRMEISGSFESAWAPPIKAFEALVEDSDFKVNLDYFEPGMSFCGVWSSETGGEEYDINPDNLDQIPEDIREQWDLDGWYEEQGEEE